MSTPTFRILPHTKTEKQWVVEVIHEGVLLCTITTSEDGPRVRLLSKHPVQLVNNTQPGEPVINIIDIHFHP